MKPKIYVVGFGPGERPYMTQQAVDAMTQADLVVGYTTYVRLLEKQFPELQYYATPMRKEADRCRAAVEAALTGKTVALVSSGDSGIYGMAGVLLEIAAEMQADVEVTAVAGVTAASAAGTVPPCEHPFAQCGRPYRYGFADYPNHQRFQYGAKRSEHDDSSGDPLSVPDYRCGNYGNADRPQAVHHFPDRHSDHRRAAVQRDLLDDSPLR